MSHLALGKLEGASNAAGIPKFTFSKMQRRIYISYFIVAVYVLLFTAQAKETRRPGGEFPWTGMLCQEENWRQADEEEDHGGIKSR